MTPERIALTPVGEMRFGHHLCLTYDSEEERHAVLTAYVRDGLRAGHKVVYLADGESSEAVLDRLAGAAGRDGPSW